MNAEFSEIETWSTDQMLIYNVNISLIINTS